MRFGLIPLTAFALVACSPDPAPVGAELQQFVRSYITSTDINASLNMLEQNATSITGEGSIVRGRDAIKDAPSKQIALLPQLKATVGTIEVTAVGTKHALAIAPFSIGASATPQKAMADGAATLLLVKRDSGWKVLHEHFSFKKPT